MKNRLFVLIVFLLLCHSPETCHSREPFVVPANQGSNISELRVFSHIPSFKLVERSGKPFGSNDLKERIWIADFIYTRCNDECPLMTSKMAVLERQLKEVSNLAFVSFTVDPGYDKPRILSKYASRHGVKPGRWFFLTGDEKVILSLITHGFHLPFLADHHDNHLLHSSIFVLVDSHGNVRGYYDSMESQRLKALAEDVKSLSKKGP